MYAKQHAYMLRSPRSIDMAASQLSACLSQYNQLSQLLLVEHDLE
jgi:hypothetical protein